MSPLVLLKQGMVALRFVLCGVVIASKMAPNPQQPQLGQGHALISLVWLSVLEEGE